MITLLDNKKWKIIQFFLENPTIEVHYRSLARKLRISTTWISKTIPELVKQNLVVISKNKETKMILIKAKRDHSAFLSLKRSVNLYSLQSSGLVDKLIENYNKPETIILFGSYAKGEDIEKSDLDLVIISERKKDSVTNFFSKNLKRTINVKILNKKQIPAEFKETLANGIVLYGYLEL